MPRLPDTPHTYICTDTYSRGKGGGGGGGRRVAPERRGRGATVHKAGSKIPT
jgi:hypothetical protein